MQGKITIVVVGYNRADAMERVLRSLSRAQYDYTDIRLVVSIDHSGNEEVVHTAEAFEWKYGEKEVIYRPERLGLRKHIISCGDLTAQRLLPPRKKCVILPKNTALPSMRDKVSAIRS